MHARTSGWNTFFYTSSMESAGIKNSILFVPVSKSLEFIAFKELGPLWWYFIVMKEKQFCLWRWKSDNLPNCGAAIWTVRLDMAVCLIISKTDECSGFYGKDDDMAVCCLLRGFKNQYSVGKASIFLYIWGAWKTIFIT